MGAQTAIGQEALPLETTRRLQYTATEGTWISLDVSPDGNTIVFELLGDLYTLPIDGGRASRITSGQGFDQQPRYSPDGARIAFVSDRNGSDNLWVASADGSDARALTSDERRMFVSPEWLSDGESIVVTKTTDLSNRPQEFHLFLYHTGGGTGVQLTGGATPDGGEHDYRVQAHLGVAFGPDDRTAYLSAASTSGYGNWQLSALDRTTGRIYQLTHEPQSAMRPIVSPDGRFLVYATRRDGETALKLIELDGGDERWLVTGVDRDGQEGLPTRDLFPGASFTPDGAALIVAYGGGIQSVDVGTGRVTEIPFEAEVDVPLGPATRFDYPLDDDPVTARRVEHPSISPDARRAAYGAFDRIWVQDLPDGEPQPLVDTETDQFFPTWSHDGQWIAFASWDDLEGGDIYRVRPDGSDLQRVTERKAFYERLAFTPDGQRIVAGRGARSQRITFADELVRGRPQSTELIWIPAAGGSATTITRLNLSSRWAYAHYGQPHFTEDGSRVFFHDPLDGLVSVAWNGTDRREVLDVQGWEWTYSPQVPADELLLSPRGDRALALANNQVYMIDLPPGGARVPTISLSDTAGSALPVHRLTTVGADYIGWTADGTSAFWSLGGTITIAARGGPTEQYTAEVTRPRDLPRGVIALRGARIVTMNGTEVIENGDLVITDNRITGIGASGSVSIPGEAEVIDVSGKTIIPGYVDIHAHMWAPWGVHRKQVWEYLANLAYGVTATRDPQTMTADVITYSDRVAVGDILGPRIFSTARGVFASEDFHSLDDARSALRRYSEHYQTETIKNYLIGDRKHRQWLIQAAREQGLTPTAEANSDFKMNLTLALDGYAGQEHSWPVFPIYEDVVRLAAESGIVYTPTFIINYGGPQAENYFYRDQNVHDDPKLNRFIPHAELDRRTLRRSQLPHESQWIFEAEAAQAAKVLAAGGSVGLGAHGQLQGMGVHWELWLLASGGMSNHDALRVGTVEGARAIGHLSDFGSLEIGKLADLQILDDNPLDDIRNSLSIERVMINGRLYDTETMNQLWPERRGLDRQWWWGNDPQDRQP
jgi:Tol biopolymer transport system component